MVAKRIARAERTRAINQARAATGQAHDQHT